MTDTTSVMPLYHQVAGVLRLQILDSYYPPSTQLPTEDELSAEFRVSRATVRQAVQTLVAEGLVVRQQGRGTFVSPRSLEGLAPRLKVSFVDAFETTYRTTSRRVDISRNHVYPDSVVEALQMASPRGTVVWRTRMLKAEPISYSITYLADWVPTLPTVARLKKISLLQFLLEEGIEVERAIKTIRATLAGPRVSEELEIELGSAVVQVEALVLDVQGRPVELARVWYRADRYEYSATVKLTTTGGEQAFVQPAEASWTLCTDQ